MVGEAQSVHLSPEVLLSIPVACVFQSTALVTNKVCAIITTGIICLYRMAITAGGRSAGAHSLRLFP
jgi:hypothetical protein